MAEGYLTPVNSIVALGTLPGIVIGWLFSVMTADAVRQACMIEDNLLPISRNVAIRTLPWVMKSWSVDSMA